MEKKEIKFAKGLIFKHTHKNAPDFIKGKVSIKVDEFKQFLDDNINNGWVNIELCKSKNGDNMYFRLDEWKPSEENKDNSTWSKDSIFNKEEPPVNNPFPV
jgi:hypothetical protein